MESESSENCSSSSSCVRFLSVAASEESNENKKKRIFVESLRQRNKKIYADFKNKLKDLLPRVFKKDVERGNFIFTIFCDIIRINNLIDTSEDIPSLEFVITEQRIKWALENFFSIRQIFSQDYTTTRYLHNYMNPYISQFKEISQIGSGGFGRVFKVQHLLDGMNYAVKKIRIKVRKENNIIKCLDEVKILARLSHHNIVSYKQAWIEASDDAQIPRSSSITSESADSDYLSSIRNDAEFFDSINNRLNKSCGELMVHTGDRDSIEDSVIEEEPVVILYIQMNLCERNLREWMDERIENSPLSDVENIGTQILSGLEFIHSKKFIHHDIKPQNIFVTIPSGNIHVQIGDFGLACRLNDELENRDHSHEIGTWLYAAPEQKNKICHQKSDTYSFGIVLFELMNSMQSESERIEKVLELKDGGVPSVLKKLYPNWVEIMQKAIEEDLEIRPSPKELLQQLKNEKDLKITRLEQTLIRDKHEISLLKAQLEKKDEALALARIKLLEYVNNWQSDRDADFPLSDDSN